MCEPVNAELLFQNLGETLDGSYDQVSRTLDDLIQQVQRTVEGIRAVQDEESLVQTNQRAVKAVKDLAQKTSKGNHIQNVSQTRKELQQAITKVSKELDKSEAAKIVPKLDVESTTASPLLEKVIAEHLYTQGRFEIADQFLQESNIDPDTVEDREAMRDMFKIVSDIKLMNLDLALSWVSGDSSNGLSPSKKKSLHFMLTKIQFLKMLHEGHKKEAIDFSRRSFTPFMSSHLPEIQRLMASVLFVNPETIAAVSSSPSSLSPPSAMIQRIQSQYKDLLEPIDWNDVAMNFARDYCQAFGLSENSPLFLCVTAGITAMPVIQKMSSLSKEGAWIGEKKLLAEVDLGPDYQFHSIFTCPVSKDNASDKNPPVLLKCGHVICQQSMLKLTKPPFRRFKCPYCPTEQQDSNTKVISF